MIATEITRLAAAIHVLRPDWPEASLRTMLTAKLAHHDYQSAAIALAWTATDPNTRTPARVIEAGPWWITPESRIANTPVPPAYARPDNPPPRIGPTEEYQTARTAIRDRRRP